MKLHSVFGALAVALLLIQACSDRDSSNKIRNFNLPNGGRVTVERMISVGQEGEQVTEYDSANDQIGVS